MRQVSRGSFVRGVGMAMLLLHLCAGAAHGKTRRMVSIPAHLIQDLPMNCGQVVLALALDGNATQGRIWCLERPNERMPWLPVHGPVPVTFGRHGIAEGLGEHRGKATNLPPKREGDGKSPAGIFALPFAYGYAAKPAASRVKIPYRHMTENHRGVDDVNSRYYNQVVDGGRTKADWEGAEKMVLSDDQYRWGLFVAHNTDPKPVAGAGSCIFIHIWKAPGVPTSGCTAMAREEMEKLLAWLNPAKAPRFVLALE